MSDISVEAVSSLIYRLSHPPKSKSSKPDTSNNPVQVSPEKIFKSWLNHQPQPFTPGTGKYLFRLLFPHEGSRRRYGLKETTLARELGKILGVDGLERWDSVRWEGGGKGGTGCLGKEVDSIMSNRIVKGTRSPMTINELDSLLDALASPSAFSQLSQPPISPLSPTLILTKLYRDSSFSPYSLSVLTQIILRDLRPLLNPLPELPIRNPTAMLAIKSNTGPAQLELLAAMRAWDGKMAGMYRGGKGSLDFCADMTERPGREEEISNGPVVGVNVQIPKCEKGRSVENALNEFCGNTYTEAASVVWAETKYDGYRMQIHVAIKRGQPIITIYSKSKRNSTVDRGNAHSIILASLGLPLPAFCHQHPSLSHRASGEGPSLSQSVILEAEVVPYNEGEREGNRGPGIEEFWWLDDAGVVADSAPGAKFASKRPKDPNRHLCVVYFDILHLNGSNLLTTPYSRRRQLLETTIRPIPGFSILCERTPIPLHLGRATALLSLQQAFTASCARGEEGLVLKSAESTYNAPSTHRWVKLKKDYIPDLGDCVDLVLLGAGWDIDRARELRVDTSVYTTWYMGVLTNGDKVRKGIDGPHFEVISRVSYGSSRQELELWNQNIRHGRWGTKSFDKDDPYKKRLIGLSWSYYMPKNMTPPSVLFEQPMCAEIMGAGFQKLPSSEMYEVRWPRLQKIYNTSERSWPDALDAQTLVQTAHTSLGYLPLDPNALLSSPEDSMTRHWRTASSFAVDVLPDTPSPNKSGSPARLLSKRNKSAPDLAQILKFSPPTPRHSRNSPLRLPTSPKAQVLISSPGRRMIEAISSKGDSPPKKGGQSRFGDYLLPTPVTSPAKRAAVGPIFSFSPVKRMKEYKAVPPPPPRPYFAGLTEMARQLQTPPPSSPILSSFDSNIDIVSADKDEVDDGNTKDKENEDSQGEIEGEADIEQMPVLTSIQMEPPVKKKWKKGMPMSLRSRIKLAMRGIVR